MKEIELISAIGKNREIGLDNHLLWSIKEDLQYYKNTTMGKSIIMGRKTYESLPPKALLGRNPIVLTRNNIDGVTCLKSLEELLEYIDNHDEKYIVIGGATIYKLLLPHVSIMYLTEVDKEYEADTYFPSFNKEDYMIEEIDNYMKNDPPYIRKKYIRKEEK